MIFRKRQMNFTFKAFSKFTFTELNLFTETSTVCGDC